MRKFMRMIGVAAMVATPFVVLSGGEAEATCDPRKPYTCEPYCPGGSRPVGPFWVCVPVDIQELVDLDCTCPPM